MTDDKGEPTTLRLRIEGFVQAVGYRNFMITEATRLGLDGWVRNRSDGTVEALVSGPQKVGQARGMGVPRESVKGSEQGQCHPDEQVYVSVYRREKKIFAGAHVLAQSHSAQQQHGAQSKEGSRNARHNPLRFTFSRVLACKRRRTNPHPIVGPNTR